MNNTIVLALATLTVILNALIGHYFAPDGILLTPFVLTITSFLVCFLTENIRVIFISILTFLFVALNDIAIKLYAGGKHDNEGLDWIHLFLFFGLIPTFVFLSIAVFKRKSEKLAIKLMAIGLFIALTYIHLQLFSRLGLGRRY
jgi:hypothetical protein